MSDSSNNPFSGAASKLADTGINGVPLQNAAPITLLSWTAPNDGRLHHVSIAVRANITQAETGGQVDVRIGPFVFASAISGGQGVTPDSSAAWKAFSFVVLPGELVAVVQSSALTAGAATIYADITGY